MSEQRYPIRTVDDSRLDVALDRYEDVLTHETDVALVVREDDRLCMCIDVETARELGALLLRLADEVESEQARADHGPHHADVA